MRENPHLREKSGHVHKVTTQLEPGEDRAKPSERRTVLKGLRGRPLRVCSRVPEGQKDNSGSKLQRAPSGRELDSLIGWEEGGPSRKEVRKCPWMTRRRTGNETQRDPLANSTVKTFERFRSSAFGWSLRVSFLRESWLWQSWPGSFLWEGKCSGSMSGPASASFGWIGQAFFCFCQT